MKSGTKLGEFTIVLPLASGGMGSVYLATGPTGERVAIKTVDTGSAAHLVSLRREIRALLAMDHPSIVRIVGHGLYEAMPWFAMEYIDGLPLRDHFTSSYETRLLDDDIETMFYAPTLVADPQDEATRSWSYTKLPAEEQRILLLQMAKVLRGLGHLHAAGLVHRDLKPENIVVRQRNQEPVIVDFGIATQSAGSARERLSRVANTAGTPAYMSPEQALGRWSDARSDLYTMGCMIHEILVGRPPFLANSFMQFAAAHLHAPVPALPDEVPADLAKLVYRLLAKAPEDRPGYAHDVAREIEHFFGVVPSTDVAPVYLYRSALVGREQAMKECLRAIDELRKGEGGLTLLTGPRGCGKTRFAIELSSAIETMRDVECVLVAHNPQENGGAGLNPFTSVLAEIADRCRELGPEFTRRVFGSQGAVLAKVYPPVLDLPGMEGVVPQVDLPAESEAMRRTQAFMQLMERVFPGRPVALVLDEFDPNYLSYLQIIRAVQNTHPTQLWLFMTVNSEHEFVVDNFARHQVVPLKSLDREGTNQLIRGALGLELIPKAFTDLLFERSGGKPALAMELLRRSVELGHLERDAHGSWLFSEQQDIPDDTDVGRLILDRVDTLPHSTQLLLRYVALSEHPIRLSVAERLISDVDVLDAVAAPLLASAILEIRGETLCITGNEVRTAIRHRLSDGDRRFAHSRLARELREDSTVDLREIALHHLEAGEVVQARKTFLAAAQAANSRGELALRWEYLRSYLETKPPVSDALFDAYLGFLTMSHRLAKTQEIRVVSEEALEAAKSFGRLDIQARILAIQATQLAASDIAEAIQVLDESMGLAESLGDDDIRCRVLVSYGHVFLLAGRGEDAEPLCREARRLSAELPDAYARASAALNHSVALLTLFRFEEAVDGLEEALQISRDNDFDMLEAYALGNLSIALRDHTENLPEALRTVREAGAIHRKCFDKPGEAHASVYEAGTLVMMRDFDAAVPCAEKAVRLNILAETGDATLLIAHSALGAALAGVGRIEEARRVFWEGRRLNGPQVHCLSHAIAAAAMERRLGMLDEAEEWLDWGSENWHSPTLDDQIYLITAHAHLKMARGEDPLWPPPHPVKPVRHVRALERSINGRHELWFGEAKADALAEMPSLAVAMKTTESSG